MIINYKHKFIFLHSRKAAGSSITSMLNPHMGPNCIQIGAWKESLDNGGVLNQYHSDLLKNHKMEYILSLLSPKRLAKFSLQHMHHSAINNVLKEKFGQIYGQNPPHMTAKNLKKHFPKEFSYFKFSVVRHPVDFEISDYFWRKGKFKYQNVSFKDFLEMKLSPSKNSINAVASPSTNWPIISINDHLQCDVCINFDNLKDELQDVLKHLGISTNSIPHAKKGAYINKQALSADEKKIILKLHSHEIEVFNRKMNWGL